MQQPRARTTTGVCVAYTICNNHPRKPLVGKSHTLQQRLLRYIRFLKNESALSVSILGRW